MTKIKILTSEPKASGGSYEAGEVYDFPADVAARWVAQGKAEAVVERRPPKPKEQPSTEE